MASVGVEHSKSVKNPAISLNTMTGPALGDDFKAQSAISTVFRAKPFLLIYYLL
jgi:hypothetical protein